MKHLSPLLRGGFSAALLILLWLTGPAAWAQAPAWQNILTATPASGSSSEISATVAAAGGTVYVTGVFTGTVTLGSTTLTSMGGYDVFVAKWNSTSASVMWAVRAGGIGDDLAYAVAMSGANVYIAGSFQSATADFGSTTLTKAGTGTTSDVFVAKLTDAGATARFGWAQQAGGTNDDRANALAVSGASVYVAGNFRSSPATFGSTSLSAGGKNDAFIAKLTDLGSSSSFVWAQQGDNTSLINALAVNGATLYMTGFFFNNVQFGNVSLTSSSTSAYTATGFLAKLTDAGSTASFTWAQQLYGTGIVQPQGIAVNGTSVYVVGVFLGSTATVGNIVLTNSTPAFLNGDVLIAKYVDGGLNATVSWALSAGGAGDDFALGVAVNGTAVYVTGLYGIPSARFGSILLTNNSTGSFAYDVFVARLTDAGTTAAFDWVQRAGGTRTDKAYAVAVSGSSVYVGGIVTSPASFGNQTITSHAVTSIGFLAALTDPTLTAATTAAQRTLPFTLAPNPARAATTVTLPAQPGTPTATLTLLDALGRTLRTSTVALPPAGLHHELDLSGLPAGVYAVQVQAGAATATRRLLVE